MKNKTKNKLIGIAVGFINGLFGSGGGMIAVPALQTLEQDQHKVHAIAVGMIFPISIVSAIFYFVKGEVDFNTLYIALAALPGGLLGSKLLYKIKTKWLGRIFYSLMIVAGIKMIF